MWTYTIITETIKTDTAYADYMFDLLYDGVIVSRNRIYSVKISEKDKVFAEMTANLPIPGSEESE